jgi:hypothetical protein
MLLSLDAPYSIGKYLNIWHIESFARYSGKQLPGYASKKTNIWILQGLDIFVKYFLHYYAILL